MTTTAVAAERMAEIRRALVLFFKRHPNQAINAVDAHSHMFKSLAGQPETFDPAVTLDEVETALDDLYHAPQLRMQYRDDVKHYLS